MQRKNKEKLLIVSSFLLVSLLGITTLSSLNFNENKLSINRVQASTQYSLTMNDGISVNGENYGVVRNSRGTEFGFALVNYTPGSGSLGTLSSGGYILNWDPFKPIQNISISLTSGSLDVYYGWRNSSIEYHSTASYTVTSSQVLDFSDVNPLYFKIVANSTSVISSITINYLCNEEVNTVSNLRLKIAKPVVGVSDEIANTNYVWVNTNIVNSSVWNNYLMTKNGDGSWYYDFSNIGVLASGYTYTFVLSDSNSSITNWNYKSSNYEAYGFSVANGQTEIILDDVAFSSQPAVPTYTVSFASNGGSGSMASESASGEYTLPSCTFTAPSGKAFLAWQINGTKKKAGESTTITSNVTATALWKYEDVTENPVTDVRSDFIVGMDASAVPSLEASGVKYYNDDYDEEDVFKILKDHGVNYIRVRIWNVPYDGSGHGYGGGNCDIDNAVEIGTRATQYGLKLLVDFHYSDFWADPAKQTAPKAWSGYTLEQKKTALYNFTCDSLQTLLDNDIDVGMVQIGNETNNFKMAGETTEANTIALMKEGSKAVREVYSDALVAVHFTNPEKGKFPEWAGKLNTYGLDYDVFGTSYYPYWHGTLDNLQSTLSTVASTYGKQVMVMETSYAYTNEDLDGQGPQHPSGSDVTPQEISIQGQYDQIRSVINTIKNTTNGLGVCYWEGTWLSINKGSWALNEPYWDTYGSGWANKYAHDYDDDAPSSNAEGCLIENQAFFDEEGKILPSINVFNVERDAEELLVNGGFEGSTSPWVEEIVSGGSSGANHTFASSTSEKKVGDYSLNIWDNAAVHLKVKQTLTSVPAGSHTFKASIMGVDSTNHEITMYVKENGIIIASQAMTMSDWDETWSDSEFTLNFINSSSTIEVGFDINFTEAGCWMYIDDASVK